MAAGIIFRGGIVFALFSIVALATFSQVQLCFTPKHGVGPANLIIHSTSL